MSLAWVLVGTANTHRAWHSIDDAARTCLTGLPDGDLPAPTEDPE